MSKPIVFMFSGQGSQYYGMGRELYENHPRFKVWMDHCDELVYPLIQTSLVHILYQQYNQSELFDRILHTNPALLCIEYSLTRLLMELGIQPDYLLGYSVGELTAAVISGAISLEDGLKLAVDYAKLLEEEGSPAGMLAIIESPSIMDDFPDIFKNTMVSGRNFQKNFVITGLLRDVQRLQEELTQKNVISLRLPVNYGFHTELIDSLEAKFKRIAGEVYSYPPLIPIISASRPGAVIQDINEDYFWHAIRRPVEFEDVVRDMLDKGNYLFIDVGPSGTLATFVKYILPPGSSSLPIEVINPYGTNLNSLEKLMATIRQA